MNINHTPTSAIDIPTLLSRINVNDYVVEIPITGDWVSYRYSPSPFTSSKKEGRYNLNGQDAFYLADSQRTAEHEIQFNYDQKELYRVQKGSIFAFDAQKFADANSLNHPLTGAKEEGSYAFCQSIACNLTETHGLSGVLYPSRQMALLGCSGQCIVLLPKTHQLVSGELQIFQE
jgi:RES domain-containing protein